MVSECSRGLSQAENKVTYSNFKDFILGQFGPGIAKHFMLPYNQKLWGFDLSAMSADWTLERVVVGQNSDQPKTAFAKENRKPLQKDSQVAYPAKGGFGEIYKRLSTRISELEFGQQVTSIDPRKKRIITSSGKRYSYHHLVSTMPLTILLELVDGVPPSLKAAARQLKSLPLKIGWIVVNGHVKTDVQRFYSAQEETPAHKIALNHNSSPYLRSLPQHGVIVEIGMGPQKQLGRTDLETWIIQSPVNIGIINDFAEVKWFSVFFSECRLRLI